jgi:CBS-domain-containing membrane protein
MIRAQDIMSPDVVTLPADMDFAAAAKILLESHFNGAPVVDDQGRLLGILCQSDLVAQHKRLPVPTLFTLLDSFVRLTPAKQLEKQVRKIAALTVAEAMTPDPVTVSPDTAIETIAGLMVDSNLHTLPVVQEGRLVGVIGKEDVLRTLIKEVRSH